MGVGLWGGGGQGGCERRIVVFVKIQKKNRERVGGLGLVGGGGVRSGGNRVGGGCERNVGGRG